MMKCRTCKDKGMLLKPTQISEHEARLDVVTCDCCGGWSKDGKDCENCQADAEGKPRPIVWVIEEEYPLALQDYEEKIKRILNDDEE
jgi:methionyl-tRNA synthetase